MNLIGDTVADLQLTINKDIYLMASQRYPFSSNINSYGNNINSSSGNNISGNNEYVDKKQKFIASIFNELMAKIDKLEPSIEMLFTGYAGKCFNNKVQFLRKVVLKCLWLSINPKYRDAISKPDIEKLDNPLYLPIYKQIFNILQEFESYYTCLWFFFQVPNYINFNVVGYRKVLEEMLDYAIENWRGSWTIKEYIKTTRGSTFYYNLVYHGYSNKQLITKWNTLLQKCVPELLYKYKQKKQLRYKSGNRIRICFISDKLQHYTSVFRDRIGVITGLNPEEFDVSIALYRSKLLNEEAVKLASSWHPVIYDFLRGFIDAGKLILLDKEDIEYNRNRLVGKFHIIFYPDIGMKQGQSLLAHSRLAPVQMTTWGHSDTSGCSEVDYYISSKYYERCDDISVIKSNYSEKPVLLSSLGTYYFNPLMIANKYFGYTSKLLKISDFTGENNIQSNVENNVGNATVYNYDIDMDKISNKKIIIGCLQSHYKINSDFENVLKDILDRLAPYYDVEIYLSNSIPFNKLHLQRLNTVLKSHSAVIKWFSNLNQKQWLEVMSKCYLMLDPYPFGGCNTSLEAFALNIPVIALPSNNISGRFTNGFYKKMGISTEIYSGVIAKNRDDYIDKVVNLISNKGDYYKLVKAIYMNKERLFEEIESITDYEKMFKMIMNK
jgi:hypothetical protein